MKQWHELSNTNKVLVTLLFMVMAIGMPELIFVVDLGGIELFFTLLFLYLKPLFMWLSAKMATFNDWVLTAKQAIKKSAMVKPKVFVTNAVFCTVALALTGSMVMSAAFILPSMLGNGVLV